MYSVAATGTPISWRIVVTVGRGVGVAEVGVGVGAAEVGVGVGAAEVGVGVGVGGGSDCTAKSVRCEVLHMNVLF